MTSETPCLSGCRHYNLTPYKEPDHAEGCPNAPKPAEPPNAQTPRWMNCGACQHSRSSHSFDDGHECLVLSCRCDCYVTGQPAEPPACRICGKAPAWNGGDWCRDCSRGKGEPQSEPLKWNSEGLAEAPGMRYCTMYGSMFLYIDGKSQGVLISTASDEASRRKAAEEDFRSRMVPPQSEPPIADGVGVGIANLFMGHEAETAGKVLARAYLSLKAERDGLKASITKRDEIDASNLTDYNALLGENAALKARMEELSESLLWATSSYEERVVILTRREKRKEQEASNG